MINERDQLHGLAAELEARVRRADRFVTTDLVLVETLASFSRLGPHLRAAAVGYVRGIEALPGYTIVRLSTALYVRGVDLYGSRLDQRYSLTDCISMLVCQDMKITDVLTSDTDFEHEGFTILLKDGA
jgi:predicted nucleic acid-binding protein